jgi:hypothetical protein
MAIIDYVSSAFNKVLPPKSHLPAPLPTNASGGIGSGHGAVGFEDDVRHFYLGILDIPVSYPSPMLFGLDSHHRDRMETIRNKSSVFRGIDCTSCRVSMRLRAQVVSHYVITTVHVHPPSDARLRMAPDDGLLLLLLLVPLVFMGWLYVH